MKLDTTMALVTPLVLGLALAACGAEETSPLRGDDDGAAPYDDSKLVPEGFAKKSADVNSVRINYIQGGQGDPIVLLHGWPESWYEWREVMPALAAKHTVIAPDLRGIGGSTGPETGYEKHVLAEDIHQLMNGAGFGSFSVIGHDIGGMVGHAHARLYPAEVKHLVIIDVPLPGVDPWDTVARDPRAWHFGFHAAPDELAEELVAGHQTKYFSYFFDHLSFTKGAIGPDQVAIFAAAYAAPESLHAGFEMYRAFPADQAFIEDHESTALDMPVLVIGGEVSLGALLPYVSDGLKAAGASNVSTHAVAKSGHWVAEEQPEELVQVLEAFLK